MSQNGLGSQISLKGSMLNMDLVQKPSIKDQCKKMDKAHKPFLKGQCHKMVRLQNHP